MESPVSLPGLALACYTGSDETCIIAKRGETLSQREGSFGKYRGEGRREPRHDDLLWKDLLARFFVPMLRSVLPDLARDIDD